MFLDSDMDEQNNGDTERTEPLEWMKKVVIKFQTKSVKIPGVKKNSVDRDKDSENVFERKMCN